MLKKLKKLFTKKSSVYEGADGGNTKKGNINIVLQPTVVVLATYILLLISKLIDLTLLNRDNEYMSVIVLQMMIFLLPGALWCKFSGERYIKSLKVNLPKPDTLVLILCATLVMASGGVLMGMLFGGLDNLSNNFSLYDTFVSKNDGSVPNALYLVLAYAALPAICEEFVYRGILCREYESGGFFKATVLSSLFFALLHFNIGNFPVYIFCGAILALVMYATRSVWGAVIAHFLYNIFGIFGQPYMATLYKLTRDSGLLLMAVGMIFFLSGALFCGEASRLYRKYLRAGARPSYKKPSSISVAYFRDTFVDVVKDPFAIACVAVYIIAVVISWL